MNEEVTASEPGYLRTGASPEAAVATVDIVDDYSFVVSFDDKYGSFPAQLAFASWRGYQDFIKPAHYLQQFYGDYGDAVELVAMMEEDSIEEGNWVTLFKSK